MENNYEAFVALKDRYNSMTFEEIEKALNRYTCGDDWITDRGPVLSSLTGFGDKSYCSLCIATLTPDEINTPTLIYKSNCDRCIWKIVTDNKCFEGPNMETYEEIENALSSDQILEAYQNRADRMHQVIGMYNIINGNQMKRSQYIIKSNKPQELQVKRVHTNQCPHCGSTMTEIESTITNNLGIIEQCYCVDCGGAYDDVYAAVYSHTTYKELPKEELTEEKLTEYKPYTYINMGWISKPLKRKGESYIRNITAIETGLGLSTSVYIKHIGWVSMEDLLKYYTWENGSPCGVRRWINL